MGFPYIKDSDDFTRRRVAIALVERHGRTGSGWVETTVEAHPQLKPLADAALAEALSESAYSPRRRAFRDALVEILLPTITDEDVTAHRVRAAALEAAAHDTRGT